MRTCKRACDILAAATALLILAPVILAVAVVIRCRLGSPVLFRQRRPGRHERPFVCLKFRTMRDACDAAGRPLPDAERLTGLGRFLRAASLDELPQLWNVLRGEMSLVGPRPLLESYLPLYDERQRRRHEVPPGITGWAQVNGRNALDWPTRLEMDVWYVEHWSFWLDLTILGRTLARLIRPRGIQQPGHATCEPFRGNPPTCENGTDRLRPAA